MRKDACGRSLLLVCAALMVFICDHPCPRWFDNPKSLGIHQHTCEARLQNSPLLENAVDKYEAKKAARRANKRRKMEDGTAAELLAEDSVLEESQIVAAVRFLPRAITNFDLTWDCLSLPNSPMILG
jgi:hypothetical protein